MVTNFHGLRMRLIHKEQIDLQIPGNYFWPSDDRPFYRPTIERISNVCLLAHNWREEDFAGWLTIGDDIESWFDEIQNGYSDHFTYRYLKSQKTMTELDSKSLKQQDPIFLKKLRKSLVHDEIPLFKKRDILVVDERFSRCSFIVKFSITNFLISLLSAMGESGFCIIFVLGSLFQTNLSQIVLFNWHHLGSLVKAAFVFVMFQCFYVMIKLRFPVLLNTRTSYQFRSSVVSFGVEKHQNKTKDLTKSLNNLNLD